MVKKRGNVILGACRIRYASPKPVRPLKNKSAKCGCVACQVQSADQSVCRCWSTHFSSHYVSVWVPHRAGRCGWVRRLTHQPSEGSTKGKKLKGAKGKTNLTFKMWANNGNVFWVSLIIILFFQPLFHESFLYLNPTYNHKEFMVLKLYRRM